MRSLISAALMSAAQKQSSLKQSSLKQSTLKLRNIAPASIVQVKRGLGLLLVMLAITGCESINVNRLAYDFLRQEDCRRNDVDVYEFCSRTFVFEYDEYEQLRQEYIRTEAEKIALEERNRLALKNAAWH